MTIIDGRALADKIRKEIKTEIKQLGIVPGLAVILVGNNPASHLYVSLKEHACKDIGVKFERYFFEGTEPQHEVLSTIQELNMRDNIHGILVQVPLPAGYEEDIVISQIDPKKDVDGFHQANLRAIMDGEPRIMPAVDLGIVALIDEAIAVGVAHESARQSARALARYSNNHAAPPLQNKKAVLIVNRTVYAVALEYMLEERGADVHIILRPKEVTPEIITKLKRADVLVVARGRANFINGDMLKNGAIVIDVGTNKLNGLVVGDVDFDSTTDKPGFITPVPGGVGPMTVAMLLKNILQLAKQSPPPLR